MHCSYSLESQPKYISTSTTAARMGKKYKTRSEAMDALGQESLQESLNGPLAQFIGPKLIQWQGMRAMCEHTSGIASM